MRDKLTAVAAGGLLLAGFNASANTITPSADAFAPGVSMTYSAKHTSGRLEPGDGFTLFDFGGYTGVLATPANWALSDSTPLNNPWGIAPGGVDDPTLPNLTFVYNGPAVLQQFGVGIYSSFVIGTISTSLAIEDWTSRDHSLTQVGGNYTIGTPHTDQILVPEPRRSPGPSVPDAGSTLIYLSLGVVGLTQLKRRFIG